MKKTIYFIVALCALFCSNAMAQTVKQKVAVYVTGDVEAGYKKVFGSKLVTGITRSENYSAVERTADFLAELSKEQDYQMSGAVSDNQIVRLGVQFGVRYVLVADVSEVFESMFVSARMIDVQTAQITNSTEASEVVNNMESLTKLAENIVLYLFYTKEYGKDEIKILGPFSTVRDLYQVAAPEGYHIATKEELDGIVQNYQRLNKKISFPIYAELRTKNSTQDQYYTSKAYYRKTGRLYSTENCHRFYHIMTVDCVFIENPVSISELHLAYTDDPFFHHDYASNNQTIEELKWSTSGLYNMNTYPTITQGYVYVIKDKEENK